MVARPVPETRARSSLLVGPLARVALGAALISTAAVFVKLSAEGGVGTSAIGAWRCLIGALVLFPLAWSLGAPKVPTPGVLRICVLAGFCFAVDLFVWHRAIILIGAGMATILANTQVFWTTALAALLYRAAVRPRFLAAACLAFLGVVLLVGVGSRIELSPDYARGVLFGLSTGLAYAGYVLSIRRAGVLQVEDSRTRTTPAIVQSMTILAWSSLVTGVALALASWIDGEPILPREPVAWWSLAGLALLPQVVGWIAIAGGLSQIAPARGALVLLIQPILATVWGVLIFAEALTWVQLLGAAMTLVAIYAGARSKA